MSVDARLAHIGIVDPEVVDQSDYPVIPDRDPTLTAVWDKYRLEVWSDVASVNDIMTWFNITKERGYSPDTFVRFDRNYISYYPYNQWLKMSRHAACYAIVGLSMLESYRSEDIYFPEVVKGISFEEIMGHDGPTVPGLQVSLTREDGECWIRVERVYIDAPYGAPVASRLVETMYHGPFDDYAMEGFEFDEGFLFKPRQQNKKTPVDIEC